MLKIRLEGEEHSAGRGVGFYRSRLRDALLASSKVEIVSASPDLVHYPYFDPFYPTLPQKLEYPTVVTIHDLTPLVLKNLYPLGLRAFTALTWERLALRRVRAVITDSLSSKKDIVNIFHLDPEKVYVVPLASDTAYTKKPTGKFLKEVKEKYRLPDKFILCVGGVNPNKNLLRLAYAAEKLRVPVVFAGSEFTKKPIATFSFKKIFGVQKVHPEVAEFAKLRTLIENDSLFQTLGYVPTEELNAVYRLATLHCLPSLYEGFGLTLLEAMTAGCLIVSANSGSLPEIYPPTTISFSPANQGQLEEALQKALALKPVEKASLIRSGRKKATDFSWGKTADLTIEVYQRVLESINV